MNCLHIADKHVAEQYLTGQLDDSQKDEFEIHILECQDCLSAVETLKDLRLALSSHAHEIRLDSDRGASRFWKWCLVAAASVALVVAVGISQRRRQGSRSAMHVASQPLPAPQTPAQTAQTENISNSPTPAATAQSTKAPLAERQHQTHPSRKVIQDSGKQPHIVPVTPATTPEPSIPAPAEVASVQSGTGAETKEIAGIKSTELTSEQALELYRLAQVRPVPFTFAGMKPSRSAPSGLSAMPGAGHDSGSSMFQLGMAAYVEGKYREASSILETASQAEPGAPNINFYLGICRLMLGRPDSAIPALSKVTSESKSRLIQPGHLYLAKAYLQKAELDRAQSELERAVSLPGSFKGEADSLLQKVRALRTSIDSGSSPEQK